MTISDIKTWLASPVAYKAICMTFAILAVLQITIGITSYFALDRNIMNSAVMHGAEQSKSNHEEKNRFLSSPFFGEYVPKNLNESDVKRSMLNLTVVGIMLSTHEDESKVIVRTANGQEKTYTVGDSLPGGATIKRITIDGALVIRNGELESLTLPKNELIFEAPAKPMPEAE
jgi:general secretion pathway protein C